MQEFWLDDADFVARNKKNQTQELMKDQQRMLRRKAIMDRATALPLMRRY